MNSYYIDYGTGAGNEWVKGSIEDAMAKADAGTCYTQCDVIIAGEDGAEICRRHWRGSLNGIGEQEHPIQYGDYGFYGDWDWIRTDPGSTLNKVPRAVQVVQAATVIRTTLMDCMEETAKRFIEENDSKMGQLLRECEASINELAKLEKLATENKEAEDGTADCGALQRH